MSRRKPMALSIRMPPAERQAAVEAFVTGEESPSAVNAQTSERPDAPAPTSFEVADSDPERPGGRGIVSRRDGRQRRRRTVYLPPALDRRLRVFCDEADLEVSEAIARAVELFLARNA